MVTTSGWIAVSGEKIDFNLEEYSLNITTDSRIGSNDKVDVWFLTSQGDLVGTFYLYFSYTPQYKIGYCMWDYTNFLTNLPPANEKVWRVTLTRTSGIRLVVHCNEVEVLNILMSDSTCGSSFWSSSWSGEVAKIEFDSSDTASDYYQPQPGSCVF